MHGAEGNRTFYDNPELDSLLEAGREETNEAARAEIYEEAQAVLVEDAPAIYINQGVSMNAYRSEVEGFYINDYMKPDFRNVTMGE